MKIEHQVNLSAFNTFGISSIAERLVRISSRAELIEYFQSNEPIPSLVLGGGSNLLITRNIEGTVLKMEIPGIEVLKEDEEHVYVEVGAGVGWHDFVLHCIREQWAGVENLSLIPGNVGTAPMQNIGAYGVEIKDVFHELSAFMMKDQTFERFNLEQCEFGYRESVFKRALKGKAVIDSVTFKLNKVPRFNTSYGAIESQLESMGVTDLSIRAISDAVIAIRESKLPDPKKIGNSGSFFKNPVIETAQFEELKTNYPAMVGYKASSSQTKVAAGWLIEAAGFKGQRYGNYGVHDKQALVLVNHGGASGKDIYDLSNKIIAEVSRMFGIQLEREVNVI